MTFQIKKNTQNNTAGLGLFLTYEHSGYTAVHKYWIGALLQGALLYKSATPPDVRNGTNFMQSKKSPITISLTYAQLAVH